ncbi:MAG: saccharopine dehydrogenase [Chlorobi bacterium]|nr:MAG: saccharopine dehydrogenase [Bacteroidota bacterium]KXK35961.1 MAG: Saccharopine dehydrogenase-like protein [Chlorobi bacterium OLB6]MBE2265984.1 saccharopine dehydrogenase NADP-binding domain-containing protein [Flavobacteriales bacterium]MBL1161426.1 saccharopine dehydrogenase [Chlorobiota bacterium]MBW7854017.1 saccharopine dehydrogenase NADP-binding domain-containing protein [Candidatus Kapabacteria bacterium]MCC6331902.1 saccharopine dehydrogenase NADP-binding domain-containing pro
MAQIMVLGAGLVGKTIVRDLAQRHTVTCVDISATALNPLAHEKNVSIQQADVRNPGLLKQLVAPFDIVVGAVPGHMGYDVLKTVIESGKNVVDISFFPEDSLTLHQLAVEHNIMAIVDCGLAPGMSNVFAGYHHSVSPLLRYECLVGGLPVHPTEPFGYKAVFSPIDVIEEYTRPARLVEDGAVVVKDALSDIESVHFDSVGTLEAFNTDGLRTLADTLRGVPDMKEKTLRYPGHAALMKAFRTTGLFGKDPVDIQGTNVVPLQLTAKLLFKQWEMQPGDEDCTVMRVTLEDATSIITYSLYDRFDCQTNTSSMARTTGYACTAAVEMVLNKKYQTSGVTPPEHLGSASGCLDFMLDYLNDRNVVYKKEVTKK